MTDRKCVIAMMAVWLLLAPIPEHLEQGYRLSDRWVAVGQFDSRSACAEAQQQRYQHAESIKQVAHEAYFADRNFQCVDSENPKLSAYPDGNAADFKYQAAVQR
jgi:hypothetical protein